MTTSYVGLWHGGASYSSPYADDAERFASIAEASDAMRDRRDHGHWQSQTFRYIFRDAESVHTPCAHSDGSGYMDLFRVTADDMSDQDSLRTYLETDAYPDVRLSFGPRGGIRRDS